jgi:DNA-binding GntR family transcriptional regulator
MQPPASAPDLGGSIADRVTATLRDEILAGTLPPGARLKILDLAARYRISPLPVREALRRLEGERLLVAQSHKGATVRLPDAKLIHDLYELRGALEALLAARAAARAGAGASGAGASSLAGLAQRWERAAARADAAAMVAANRDFHDRIATLADNPEAADAATRGWPLTVALRVRLGFSPERQAAIAAEHRALAHAIVAGDQAAAARIAAAHVADARDELLARMAAAGIGQPAPQALHA